MEVDGRAAPQPPLDCDMVVSGVVPSDVARSSGRSICPRRVSRHRNASSFHSDEDVPLLIPEISADHLNVLDRQKRGRGFSTGYIVTNPNCSTIIAGARSRAARSSALGLESVIVTTLQDPFRRGLSPAWPSARRRTDNVVPFIENEEEKIERETLKILGRMKNGKVEAGQFAVSAQCHRVNVTDGHLGAVRV